MRLDWFVVLTAIMLFIVVSLPPSSHTTDRKLDAIKDCNRLGGIYTEGVCQHPFAPICRRVGYYKKE